MKTAKKLVSIASCLCLGALTLVAGCDGNSPPFNTDAGTNAPDGLSIPRDGRVVTDVWEWVGDGTVCGSISRVPELPPFDMLLALDTSYSMDFKEKWLSVKAALKVFAKDDRFSSMGVGLQYFPLRAQCNASDYEAPDVPIAPLPMINTQLTASLDNQRMSGGTPMVPMLTGVLKYAKAWAKAHPERSVAVILATDGIPDNTCLVGDKQVLPNTLDNLVTVAKTAVADKPRVPVFVIGVGSELTTLDEIAAAGGSKKAFLVDTAKNISTAFLQALNEIRSILACEYEIPAPPSTELLLDYTKVRVRFTIEDKNEQFFSRVANAAACTPNGWYLDDDKNPTRIILCEEACKKSHSEGGKIEVVFGCNPKPD
ncbi:MAG: hypothetical protein CSA65_06845 [Proteobacteria bacterium]|nr:MAG: hypothetical protein CSA65_06845 [Pseudomonadota bacterium]